VIGRPFCRSGAAALLICALTLGGCSGGEAIDDPAAWRAGLLDDRARKDEEFGTSPTSPMAGVQYLKSDPADRVALIRDGESFDLVHREMPDAVVQLARAEEAWVWTRAEAGVGCRAGQETLALGAAIEKPATFGVGRFHLRLYPDRERVTFIVFDAERPEQLAFERLRYFDPDPAYAVQAELERLDQPEPVRLATSRDLQKTLYRFARIQFRIGGRDLELTAFKYTLSGEDSSTLFVPFRDRTTGEETYGAGRFLELEEPDDDRFVLDFNRAFNPLCSYSPAYNCAIPPRENHLPVAIRAGELSDH
jgi:uncharacterized protein (DUF1684 family)